MVVFSAYMLLIDNIKLHKPSLIFYAIFFIALFIINCGITGIVIYEAVFCKEMCTTTESNVHNLAEHLKEYYTVRNALDCYNGTTIIDSTYPSILLLLPCLILSFESITYCKQANEANEEWERTKNEEMEHISEFHGQENKFNSEQIIRTQRPNTWGNKYVIEEYV